MDPDIPLPSIEHADQPAPSTTVSSNNFTRFRDTTATPLASSSPSRTPYKTPLSHPATPAPISIPRSPSVNRYERHSSPNLVQKRSSSSLSVSRGQTPSRMQLRRVSSNLNPSSPSVTKGPEMLPTPPAPTASSVATEFFQRELAAHSNIQSKTIVFVHDSCYGHRFSRPRASKAALATIVERPERILATVLGASTAYVRLGERHADGAYGPHPARDVKTLSEPPFLLRKTTRTVALNHPAVTHVHGTKWMEELQIMCDSAESKLAMNGKELQRPIGYGKDESGNSLPKLHEGDLYLCSESLAALQGCLGGVCDAVDVTFTSPETKRAFVCIRPPGHHCSSNYPSGFCWLNNVHVGISYAAISHGLTHAAIIDFDLHHGDGSQTIAWDHNRKAQSLPKNAAPHKKTPIGYYSLHDINSYPCEWGDEEKVRSASLCIENAHGQSIWNVHLEPWTSLEHFWQLYEAKYKILIDKTRVFLRHHSEQLRAAGVQPKAAIFISAGFDASQWEGQGMQRHNVNVPTDFYARFTADIVQLSNEAGLGVDGRVISVLEGGYSDRALTSGVMSHICGLTDDTRANKVDPHFGSINGGLGVGPPSLNGSNVQNLYEPSWWEVSNLEALEDRVAGNVASVARKKDKAPGNYASPTQAFTSKMTEVARERKSLSTQLENRIYLESLAPDPPPPVDWVVAAYELSRILIPTDRQTLSCRHDELNAEATKVRRERQSMVGVAAPTEQRMQLRTRSKVAGIDEMGRTASRTGNRRTTIAVVSELPDPSMPEPGLQRPRRRSSAASSILSSFQDMKLDDRNHATESVSNLSRPPSVMADASRDTAAKKARMPTAAKRIANKVSSPRKAKNTLQGSSDTTNLQGKVNPPAARGSAGSRLSSQSGRGDSDNVASRDHMDDLSNGLKKVSIKLKMPTPEQHAENLKKAEEAKTKKPRVSRKPPVPKAPKLKAETIKPSDATRLATSADPVDSVSRDNARTETSGHSHPRDSSVLGESTHPIPNGHEHVAQWAARTVSSTNSTDWPTNGPNAGPATVSARAVASNVTAQGSANDAASRQLPPSREQSSGQITATPPKAKSGLPIFTSNSHIPFAGHEGSALAQQPQAKHEPSVWDVPETPHH